MQAFTTAPAKVMGLLNQIGTIQPGMIADMDIIRGNPIQDIETIANDDYVMQNGRLLTRSRYRAVRPCPAEHAARLLDAGIGRTRRGIDALTWKASLGDGGRGCRPDAARPVPVPPGERQRSGGGQRRRSHAGGARILI